MIIFLIENIGFGLFLVIWLVLSLMAFFVLVSVLEYADTLHLTTRFQALVAIILMPIMLPLYTLLCIGYMVWALTYPIYVFAVKKPHRVSFWRYIGWDF